MSRRRGYRYGPWHGGRDPLAPPYDVREAVDAVGDDVLAGLRPDEALRNLLRRGREGLRGTEDMLRRVREQQRRTRDRGRLDGTLREVRELLEAAMEAERSALFPDPSDAARLAETELDALPDDTSRAVRELSDYQWRSPEARESFERIQNLLRSEVLDAQFAGMKNALEQGSGEQLDRVKDMLADLNTMLAADARGEHTQQQFDEFMDKHSDFFPDQPQTLDELVDSLARRAAATQRMLESLTPEQREELGGLMAQAMRDVGLASEMARLSDALRAARPDLRWGGQERMTGEQPLGMGDATGAVAELADLAELEATLGQDYAGASLDDVDPDLLERALGRAAADDLAELRRIERELERQGYVRRDGGKLELSPKAVRRLGATALRRVFAQLESTGRGEHDVAEAGAAGELTGASRPWRFGDTQPLDVVRTVRNAVLRSGPSSTGVRLKVDDFEVVETERRTQAAVCLLVDMSWSMTVRGTWSEAKTTALALHSLVTTQYPQDAIEIVGFSDYARRIDPAELAGMEAPYVQGTNLQHALVVAGRHLARHPDAEPIVLCVTDGEPTAHLEPDGRSYFDWPPAPETLAATLAEVEKLTRRGITINVFLLDDEPRLVRFVEHLARRNGGRVLTPDPARLGDYVVSDYLRMRRGSRAR